MSDTVIRVENLSKQYRLGMVGTGALSHDINRWWHKIRGKEDPYLKIGEENDRTRKGNSDYVWALKNINFEVKRGEVLGIIGRNGAGKSTLLKILSRTTAPTKGHVKIKGRVASLLEVGTGFNPELSGRANIFLNGAILGMSKKEIQKKIDEIVDFSGVERYIDTPVKRYSSGMYVRLAFAVAAHLEPEILILDEILAVGDAEFQKKCLGKMKNMNKAEGRTIAFVSHNIGSIKQLCSNAFVMNNGSIVFSGSVDGSAKFYSASSVTNQLSTNYRKSVIQNNDIELLEGKIMDEDENEKWQFDAEDDILIKLKLAINSLVPKVQGYFVIKDHSDEVFIESDTFDSLPNILEELEIGIHELLLKIPRRTLPNGSFLAYLNFTSEFSINGFTIDSPKEILNFEVVDLSTRRGLNRRAKTSCIIKWNKIKCSNA